MAGFFSFFATTLVCAVGLLASTALGAESDAADLAPARAVAQKTFKDQVTPFLNTYCGRCHTGNRQRGGVTFASVLKDPFGPAFSLLWKRTEAQIGTHTMPPEEYEKQPTVEERKMVLEWIAGLKRLRPKDPGPFVIRRLNKVEYGNTLRDLFGVEPSVARDLPDEVIGAGYTNTLSAMVVEQYLLVANEVLDRAFAPPGAPPTAVQSRLCGRAPMAGADPKVAARKAAKALARLAYRRPASDEELDVLMRVFALAEENGKSYPEAMRLVVKAVLVSPQFLFITPGDVSIADTHKSGEIVPLDDYQLASRLSYLLWASMPDAELSALADAGKLRDPEVLAAQTRRMIADPKSRALFDGFGAQWLGLDKIATKTFDAERFPQMTPALRSAMYEESRLFFEHIVREDRPVTDFIDGDYTFVNGTLALIYGLEGKVRGDEMRKVKLTNANRGGILMMPGPLATSSFPERTSAVKRGVWVLEEILGEHVPPVPANVPPLDNQDKQKVAGLTLRQRTELHTTDPACANCHKILDPIGFGLENFDAIGRWRDQDDSGGKIDAAGELPGGHKFTTPAELKQIIAARKDDFCRNLTGKLLAYGLCRQLEGYDEVVVDKLADTVAKDGYRMQALVVGVVTSYPFTHRLVSNPKEVSNAK